MPYKSEVDCGIFKNTKATEHTIDSRSWFYHFEIKVYKVKHVMSLYHLVTFGAGESNSFKTLHNFSI